MDSSGMLVVVLVAMLLVAALAVLLLLILLLRRPRESTSLLTTIQATAQAIGTVQVELRGLSERVATVERGQNQVGQSIAAIGIGLAQTGTLATGLVEATSVIRAELSRAQDGLTSLQAHAKARQELEKQTAESVRRLEAIIAGAQTKDTAGENIIELVFAQLPPDWQVRDFQIANKTVEFGLRLPNNLVLPIDSKWPATHLLEQWVACDNPAERLALKAQIEAAVLAKARDVRKYIDPDMTVNFAIAAVPDAVYDLCSRVQVEAFRLNVVLVSYSMFVPYLLLAFQMILRTSQNIDLQKLDAYLERVQDNIQAMQDELEGRFSRAVTMLNNSRDDLRAHLGRISSGLTGLQIGTGAAGAVAKIEQSQSGDNL